MRNGLIIFALALFLAGCRKPTQPEPTPEPGAGEPGAVEAPLAGARTMTVAAITFQNLTDVDPALLAALDAELRAALAWTRRYELVDEGGELSLTPRIDALAVHEVGGGGRFTMRDLGLDPGPEFVEGAVVLHASLGMDGETVEETVAAKLQGGKETPGVSRQDLDRDGRLELHVTPEGVAALVRPAMRQLAMKLVARTHPAPPEEGTEKAPEPAPEG